MIITSLSLEDNGGRSESTMSATSTTISLADYRERTAEQRRFEEEEYHNIVDNLPIMHLEHKDNVLVIHYDGSKNDNLVRRIKQNPAWGLSLFGVIQDIWLGDFYAIVTFPYTICIQTEQKINGDFRQVVLVTFLTQNKNYEDKIVLNEGQIRKRPRALYTFR